MTRKRILIVASHAGSLIHFRGDFIDSLVASEYDVYAAAPNMDKETINSLQKLRAVPIEYKLHGTGLNPIKDIRSIFQLRDIIRTYDIDLVFPYTIKPVIYSSIAARLTNTPIISLITGLGFAFSASSFKSKVLQLITEFLYKVSIQRNSVIIFQNPDDRQLFIERNLISKNQITALVSGSGVNLARYPYRLKEKFSDNLKFVMVARMIIEKGINIYIDSAKEIKQKFPNAEFHVIGAPVDAPSAIKLEYLEELDSKGIIIYHGHQADVSSLLHDFDVFVLPTFYREGIPRSILEALSIGMPIITTNTPGCRETIKNGMNGFLIEPKDQKSLTQAMIELLEKPNLVASMGKVSRSLAEEKFNVTIINHELLKIIKEVII